MAKDVVETMSAEELAFVEMAKESLNGKDNIK